MAVSAGAARAWGHFGGAGLARDVAMACRSVEFAVAVVESMGVAATAVAAGPFLFMRLPDGTVVAVGSASCAANAGNGLALEVIVKAVVSEGGAAWGNW